MERVQTVAYKLPNWRNPQKSKLDWLHYQPPFPVYVPYDLIQTVTADVRSQRHLTVVDHGLSTRSSVSSTKAAAVHLRAAERALAERLKHKQKKMNSPAETHRATGRVELSQPEPGCYLLVCSTADRSSAICTYEKQPMRLFLSRYKWVRQDVWLPLCDLHLVLNC